MKNIGIQLDNNYDLIINPVYKKGEYKEHPVTGIGINNICNDGDLPLWKREITEQLEADGQYISKLVLNENEFILEARYL